MKMPTHATLLLGKNVKYPIEKIHFETRQITLCEKPKVYNTVSAKDVVFDFSYFTDNEIKEFEQAVNV